MRVLHEPGHFDQGIKREGEMAEVAACWNCLGAAGFLWGGKNPGLGTVKCCETEITYNSPSTAGLLFCSISTFSRFVWFILARSSKRESGRRRGCGV